MSEKRHKINKFANYQNKMVRDSPALTAMFFGLGLTYSVIHHKQNARFQAVIVRVYQHRALLQLAAVGGKD